MRSEPLFLLLSVFASTAACASASPAEHAQFWRRSTAAPARSVPPEGYYNPKDKGGHMLTEIAVTYPMGQGEPLNAIISGNSDPRVLVDQETNGGLRNYFLSLGFSGTCLGQHQGTLQAANLGDGHGSKNETAVMRWNYGDPQLGACKETIMGGNHFRYWVQDGPDANSGAIFMAVSEEMSLSLGHDIIPNGYNLGRDWLIGNITGSMVPTPELTNQTTYQGTTRWANWTYQNDIKYVPGLLANSSDSINHNWTVSLGGTVNAADGLVAVIEVKIVGEPPKSRSGAWRVESPFDTKRLMAAMTIFYVLPIFLFW